MLKQPGFFNDNQLDFLNENSLRWKEGLRKQNMFLLR